MDLGYHKQYDLQQFQKDLDALQITLSEKQIQQFVVYYEMLIARNESVNLTAITDFEEVCKKHFIDSLSLVKVTDLSGCKRETDISCGQQGLTLIDIGTGAGFPGIPLKIAFPDLRVTLLDSLNKRVDFLNEVISELGLKEIEAIHGRAEDYARPGQLREQYDLCVSRAVANLSVLTEYCLPYVKVGGSFVAYKSEKAAEEMEEAENAISILGGGPAEQISFMLPDSDIGRSLVTIAKVNTTPAKYPRKAGTASRKPIK